MTPTVGRIVYYKSYGTPGGEYLPEDRAAIVTFVHNPTCVDLAVFNPTGMFFNQRVTQGSKGGEWDWMPFQKQQAAVVSAAPWGAGATDPLIPHPGTSIPPYTTDQVSTAKFCANSSGDITATGCSIERPKDE